jgi:hypothetical protein
MNDDEELLRDYVNFDIDFRLGDEEMFGIEELFDNYLNGCPMASVKILNQDGCILDSLSVKGTVQKVGFMDTQSIIVCREDWENIHLDISGLTTIPVIIEAREKLNYYALWFNEISDCVDWERSEIIPWPRGATLNTWNNPKGEWFIRPVLDAEKIPSNLDVFRLKDWSGPFNFIVNEKVAEKLLMIHDAKILTDLREVEISGR